MLLPFPAECTLPLWQSQPPRLRTNCRIAEGAVPGHEGCIWGLSKSVSPYSCKKTKTPPGPEIAKCRQGRSQIRVTFSRRSIESRKRDLHALFVDIPPGKESNLVRRFHKIQNGSASFHDHRVTREWSRCAHHIRGKFLDPDRDVFWITVNNTFGPWFSPRLKNKWVCMPLTKVKAPPTLSRRFIQTLTNDLKCNGTHISRFQKSYPVTMLES